MYILNEKKNESERYDILNSIMKNENEYIFWPLTPLFLNPKNYRPCVLRDLQWSAALHCGTNNCVISSYNGNLTHYILLNLHLKPRPQFFIQGV